MKNSVIQKLSIIFIIIAIIIIITFIIIIITKDEINVPMALSVFRDGELLLLLLLLYYIISRRRMPAVTLFSIYLYINTAGVISL